MTDLLYFGLFIVGVVVTVISLQMELQKLKGKVGFNTLMSLLVMYVIEVIFVVILIAVVMKALGAL